MTAPIPCRICACIDGEPGLCHAVTANGFACYRVEGRPDWCSACSTWERDLRQQYPAAPVEFLATVHRAKRADEAASKRGASVPGAFALRVHAARLRRKARQILVTVGMVEEPAPAPIKERDKPLCP